MMIRVWTMLQKETLRRTSECRVEVRSMSCGNDYKSVRQTGILGQINESGVGCNLGNFWDEKSVKSSSSWPAEEIRRAGWRWAEVGGNICCFRVQATVLET